MNQAIEDYFLELLSDADIAGAPDIYPGTCSEIRQPDNSAILIVADSVECVIATLHKASVKLVVSSPAQDREAHAAMAAAVKELVEGTLPSSDVFLVGGWRTKSNLTQVSDDSRWLTSIEGVFGLKVI
jgi:hypothetical protein